MMPNLAIASPGTIGKCPKAIAITNYLNIYLYPSTCKDIHE
ncbi:MAG: hypothetical protein V7K62_13415 [Nostoc sp.]